MRSDPILDFFEVIIPRGGVVHAWHYGWLFFRQAYIFITNLRFLGFLPPGVLEFLQVSYPEVFQKGFPFNYRIFYSLYGKKLVHIYDAHQEKIGFALFRSGPRENIHLCSMGILHKFRGQGLSKPHLAKSLDSWKQAGFKSSSLYVEISNVIAVKTYKSLGYQPMKYIDDMVYMTKML